jgi:hypothetical protein
VDNIDCRGRALPRFCSSPAQLQCGWLGSQGKNGAGSGNQSAGVPSRGGIMKSVTGAKPLGVQMGDSIAMIEQRYNKLTTAIAAHRLV